MANKILIVCGGNTDRSPMAKVIPEQLLKERGLSGSFIVDSAARDQPTLATASSKARDTIKWMYNADLLANHKSKSVSDIDLNSYKLILTMTNMQKEGLPAPNTHTLKEYAGLSGDIDDPYCRLTEVYWECATEIKSCLELALKKIT